VSVQSDGGRRIRRGDARPSGEGGAKDLGGPKWFTASVFGRLELEKGNQKCWQEKLQGGRMIPKKLLKKGCESYRESAVDRKGGTGH